MCDKTNENEMSKVTIEEFESDCENICECCGQAYKEPGSDYCYECNKKQSEN